jgi:ankyrin repeat protein
MDVPPRRRHQTGEGQENRNCASLIRVARVTFVAIACSLLCSCGINEAESESAWLNAIATGDVEVVEKLISEGHDPGALTETSGRYGHAKVVEPAAAIHIAAALGRRNVLERFLEAGVDVDLREGRGYTPLLLAVLSGAHDVVELLLERGAAVEATTSDGWTALTLAAVYEYDLIIKQLISHGADVNQAHAQGGITAIIIAAGRGNIETVEHLLAHGADVNATTESGYTAYLGAARNDHIETMKQLAAAGANIHHVDDMGYDALMHAAAISKRAVEHLLAMGFDPNRDAWKGNTAVHEAAEYGSASMIMLLVEAGGDLHLQNDKGVTPLQILQSRDDADAQAFLDTLNE